VGEQARVHHGGDRERHWVGEPLAVPDGGLQERRRGVSHPVHHRARDRRHPADDPRVRARPAVPEGDARCDAEGPTGFRDDRLVGARRWDDDLVLLRRDHGLVLGLPGVLVRTAVVRGSAGVLQPRPETHRRPRSDRDDLVAGARRPRRHVGAHLLDHQEGRSQGREGRDDHRPAPGGPPPPHLHQRHHAPRGGRGSAVLPDARLQRPHERRDLAPGVRAGLLLAESRVRNPDRLRELPPEEVGHHEQRVHDEPRGRGVRVLRRVRGLQRPRLPRTVDRSPGRERRQGRAWARVRER